MTHAELLAKINPSNTTDQETYLAPYKALRAVLELHKKDVRGNCDICTYITNGGLVAYPCFTIQAIEKELA